MRIETGMKDLTRTFRESSSVKRCEEALEWLQQGRILRVIRRSAFRITKYDAVGKPSISAQYGDEIALNCSPV